MKKTIRCKMDIRSKVLLNDGNYMPILGFGTYLLPKSEVGINAILTALDAGYRQIDTASIYDNEEEVGQAIKASSIKREEIFVTTKLWNDDQGYDSALLAFDRSLKRLQLDYIDLYLLHWPVPKERINSFKAMMHLKASNKCRSIGVSNFMIRHLEELMDATGVIPQVNQIEFSPFLYQKDLLDYCQKQNIIIQAYAPLTVGKKLLNSTIQKIAQKHHKTPAQILLRWSLQHGLVPIVKSSNKDHILENSLIFDFNLESSDIDLLDALNENFRTSWDPSNI